MALRNGPIRAGDLSPHIIDAVEVIRDDEPVMLRGYVMGSRCPSRVKSAAIAAVRDNPMPGGLFDFGTHLTQVRELLGAVVIGLEDGEADVLAGNDTATGGVAVLRLLGFWNDGTTDDEGEDDADPEAPAESSTSEKSSRSSRRSTGRTTG